MCSVHRIAVAVALTAALASPAHGQRVRGMVSDSASGQPVAGAVLWLADSSGAFLARSVSGVDGQYAVLRLAGSTQLRVLRIGFRPVVIPLASGSRDTTVDVHLGAIALMLDTVAASRQRVCPGDKGTSDALQLWEQARAALLAGVVARDANPPELRLRSFTRSFDAMHRRMLDQVVRGSDVVGDRSYVAGRPGWALADEGYMREGPDGDRTFFAPDEDVLVDPTFADTHCLHVVVGGRSHASDVGIGFDPVEAGGRDTLVDVRGVLWIDAVRHELRSLEFQYTGLEHEARGSGGEVTFESMPNGTPMITHWTIHAAVLAVEVPPNRAFARPRARDRRDRTDVQLVEWRDEGGLVASARWPNGQAWRASLRRISGMLVGQLGRPVVGARVWLWNAPDTTVSDSAGVYVLDDVIPGVYLVLAADSDLADVGVIQGRRAVDVRAADHLEASVLVVPSGQIVGGRCRGQSMPAQTGALLGRVVDVSGAPQSEVRIEAVWSGSASEDARGAKPDRVTKSDDEGRFAICGAPLGGVVRLHAASGAQSADVRWTQRPLVTMSVVLRGS